MKSTVYFTKEITSESLIKIYEALGVQLNGKVAVKISTGEPGGHNFLNPNLIKDLVSKLNGTIVECCTAYGGKRDDPKEHWKAVHDHGFSAIAPCDIMDEEGDMQIPINGGKHLDGYNVVGAHLANYDSMLMLSHFKGHVAGGFGGALKNMSIGVASQRGKARLHSVGISDSAEECWKHANDQDGFLECMAEACKSVVDYMGSENIVYISVANRLSIDCDCASNPAEPEMADIGIFASLDPVALDQCCYDQIMNSADPGKASLVERMVSRHAIHTVEWAAELGLGNREYEIVELK